MKDELKTSLGKDLNGRLDEQIRVIVSKRLPKKSVGSIVRDFIKQRLTFALSSHKNGKTREYQVWRQILPGDLPRSKMHNGGDLHDEVIERDKETLNERNFVCIWENGECVHGNEKKYL